MRNPNPAKSRWLKAAVLGSVWAASEIVLGSFLHNLRVPFCGYMLTGIGVALLVAGHQLWPERGLLWRAGLVCAVMKSMSPSAVIFGPMIAIFMEAALLEAGTVILGRNLAGYLLGGGLAASWCLVQKIASLLIFYGSNIFQLYVRLCAYVQGQLGLQGMGYWEPMIILLFVHFASGCLAAALGVCLGKRACNMPVPTQPLTLQGGFGEKTPCVKARQTFSLKRLFMNLSFVVGGLFILDKAPLWGDFALVAAYSGVGAIWYRSAMNRLKRPGFWLGFVTVTMLAGLLLGGLGSNETGLSLNGALIGLEMNLRAALLIVGFSAIGVELRNPRIKSWLENRGAQEFFLTVETAFQALPAVIAGIPRGSQVLRSPLASICQTISQFGFWLDDFQERAARHSKVYIIAGRPGTGKSALLADVVAGLKRAGLNVRGICAPGIWKQGKRYGFDLIDMLTGARAVLCRRDDSERWPSLGPFRFRPEGLAFGHKALAMSRVRDADLVVVDEVGPLELKGNGWTPELNALVKEGRKPMIWVVRLDMVKEICQRWSLSNPPVWEVGRKKIDAIVAELVRAIA